LHPLFFDDFIPISNIGQVTEQQHHLSFLMALKKGSLVKKNSS